MKLYSLYADLYKVAPFEEIDRSIELIITEKIVYYRYDSEIQRIVLK